MPKVTFSDDRVSQFHPDQVWESPRGYLYRVVACARGGVATLRAGAGGAGAKVTRPWDAVMGWVLVEEAPIKTHRLALERPDPDLVYLKVTEGLSGDGRSLGAITVNLRHRKCSLGYGQGIPNPFGEGGFYRIYKGRGWESALMRDAIARLADALEIEVGAIAIDQELSHILNGGP